MNKQNFLYEKENNCLNQSIKNKVFIKDINNSLIEKYDKDFNTSYNKYIQFDDN
jgi:hypothetical protein